MVLGNRVVYVQRMKELLSEASKFIENIVEAGKKINLLL